MYAARPPTVALRPEDGSRRPSAPSRLPRLARGLLLVVALAFVVDDDLLSAQLPVPSPPQEQEREYDAPPKPAADGVSVVVRQGRQLVRYREGNRSPIVQLPDRVGRDDDLVAVDEAGSAPIVFGVAGHELFRIDVAQGRVVASAGAAESIVDTGPRPGELLLEVVDAARSVVVLDAVTNNVLDPNPFPGYDGRNGWRPRGMITTFMIPGVVLSRPGQDGREEFALAWSERAVASGLARRSVSPLGRPGRLLGMADDWILFLSGECPGHRCVLRVVTFLPGRTRTRVVRPPEGWSFVPGDVGGAMHELLVPVVHDRNGRHALARLVDGADSALLLRASTGLVPSGGLVAKPDGSVYFVLADGGGTRMVARWSPVEVPHLATFPELPRLPHGASVVCECAYAEQVTSR